MRIFGAKMDETEERAEQAGTLDIDLTPLKDVAVLLVEDNDFNQQVAMDLLTDLGMRVDVAENGAVALEKIAQKDYGLVLMDMQMPVMDGVTATREIRSRGYLDLPILAMTANAMQADQERCLEAGMNDYLAKPIDPDLLIECLLRWVKRRANVPKAEKKALIPAAGAKETLLPAQIDGLDLTRGLRQMRGKKSFYRDMLIKFATSRAICRRASRRRSRPAISPRPNVWRIASKPSPAI